MPEMTHFRDAAAEQFPLMIPDVSFPVSAKYSIHIPAMQPCYARSKDEF